MWEQIRASYLELGVFKNVSIHGAGGKKKIFLSLSSFN